MFLMAVNMLPTAVISFNVEPNSPFSMSRPPFTTTEKSPEI